MDIRIVDVEWALDDAGATYQAYVVEIARGLKTWAVRRRYSAFDDLRRAVSKELGPLASPFPGKNLFGRADPAKRQRELEARLRELALAVAPAAAAYAAFTSFIREPPDAAPSEKPPEKPARRPSSSRPRRRPSLQSRRLPQNGTRRSCRPTRSPASRTRCRNRFHRAGAQTPTQSRRAIAKARGRGRPEIPADDGARDVFDGERQDLRRDGRGPARRHQGRRFEWLRAR